MSWKVHFFLISFFFLSNVHERNEWLEALNSAIEDYRSKKATFLTPDQSSHQTKQSSERLGDCAPLWVPDAHVTMCQACSCNFTLIIRRHHCRACGRVVCYQCADNKAPLRYRQFQPARVCDACYGALEKSKSCQAVELYLLFTFQFLAMMRI